MKMMNSYNNVLEKLILPLGDIVFGTSYVKYLKKNREIVLKNETELKHLQKEKLRKILLHANKECKLYQNIILENDDPYQWIKSFPILNKEDINTKYSDLLTVPLDNLVIIKSSGSSGIQSQVYMSKEEQSNLFGILTSWWELEGYRLGNKVIQTGISPERGIKKKLKDVFFRTTYMNAFNSTEETIFETLEKIKNNKEIILIGYASSLNSFAEVALKYDLKIKFKSIISLGDKLFNHYKKNLDNAFNSKVFDTYGSSEGFMIGFQYDLDYLYQYSPQTYLEILEDNNNPVQDGKMGHVVVTRLDGYSMPLIRYKLGDLAIKLPKNEYPKNRKLNFPILKQIIGRNTDVIKTPQGKILNVHFFTGIFEHFQQIKQYRILQIDINSIKIEIITNENFNENVFFELKQKLENSINELGLNINFEFVDFIPTSPSGKPEILKSMIVHK